ncbi:ABC transporter permease [Anaerobacillus sp. MEB173]|uniref:ABC transporter permease n=1 Tax=Anaerobacillus sp. MEB173 TaxID=3383345 RepID=UPI003F92C9DB
MDLSFNKIPIGDWIEVVVNFLITNLGGFFNLITTIVGFFVDTLQGTFASIPPLLFIVILILFSWWISQWKMALFTAIGLLLVINLGLWTHVLFTLSLVLTAVLISVLIGVPLGILCAKNDTVNQIVTPILDFMQTMPAFVYLIPAIFFFGLGMVPGVFASVVFAMPPTIRLTNFGIRQVNEELIEASDSFGATGIQKLIKVQLPVALPTVMTGINQSIMLALSMVVIASMIGAPGLGTEVYRSISQLNVGMGFEAGLAIVIVAIILDRLTQNIGKRKKGNLA